MPKCSKKNIVETMDKVLSIVSTSRFWVGLIGFRAYFMPMIQCSKSLALPSAPVSFLCSLLFSFEV